MDDAVAHLAHEGLGDVALAPGVYHPCNSAHELIYPFALNEAGSLTFFERATSLNGLNR